jgi:glycine dehydrogenase subunit 1
MGEGADIAVAASCRAAAPRRAAHIMVSWCKALVRQMPGPLSGVRSIRRQAGVCADAQAREQHIRRSATSNICTNQGLVVTASRFMALLGPED